MQQKTERWFLAPDLVRYCYALPSSFPALPIPVPPVHVRLILLVRFFRRTTTQRSDQSTARRSAAGRGSNQEFPRTLGRFLPSGLAANDHASATPLCTCPGAARASIADGFATVS
jgi:hypothetical protein